MDSQVSSFTADAAAASGFRRGSSTVSKTAPNAKPPRVKKSLRSIELMRNLLAENDESGELPSLDCGSRRAPHRASREDRNGQGRSQADALYVEYASIGGHVQTKFRSPYASSIRPTLGQNLQSRTQGAGKAACSRLYGRSHSLAITIEAVWGALLSRLFVRGWRPSMMSWISARIRIIASQNRSNSAFDSLSVGSIINVPATGNDTVGAWKP